MDKFKAVQEGLGKASPMASKESSTREANKRESEQTYSPRTSNAGLTKPQGSMRSRGSFMSQMSSESAFPDGPNTTGFSEEDINTAWKMLCPQGLEQTVMSKSQVLESLRSFFPYISAREVKELVGPGNLSLEKLKHLLFHPDVPEFDANVEAFKIVDPHGTGYMDGHALARLVLQLPGIGYIDEDDLKAIMAVADPDQDGRISLKDFSTIGSWLPDEIDEDSPNCLLPNKRPSSPRHID